MKILFVHERFGAFAGAEVNVLLTATELKRRGHDVGIVHGPGTGKGGAAWGEVFTQRFPLSPENSAETVRNALAAFRPDAIYVHKIADVDVLQGLVECGRPLVRMVHDHDLYCMRSYKYNPLTRKICARAASAYCVFPCGAPLARNRGGGLPFKWVSYRAKLREIDLNRRFQRMIVATEFMRDELERNRFDPARIEIHAPVPRLPDHLPPASFSDRNLILYSGQIVRGKGVDVLLQALALIREPFECVILGDGNHRLFCEALSRGLNLADRVHFKGYVPQDDVRRFHADGSLAVMSSVWPEPFGATGLEAMLHGLPVVAFDAGGIKEWLIDGQNGLLAPWMDRAGYADRVGKLLRDKSLARRLGENGRKSVREKFDFDSYITRLEDMFTRVIAEASIIGKP